MSQRKFIIDGGFLTSHDSIVDADLQINGNLVVNGVTTEVNKTTMNVTTNTVFLNAGVTGAPTQDAFLSVVRGNETNVSIRWNETSNQWEFTNDGVNFNALGSGSGTYSDSLAVLAVEDAGYALETWVTDQIAISTQLDRQWVTDNYTTIEAVDTAIANNVPVWGVISANATVEANSKNLIDTSAGAMTITLPSNPSTGTEVMFVDGAGMAATHNITIDGNGAMIQGIAGNMTIDTNRAAFQVVYFNPANGWVFMEV